ncbi:hypothetical protein BDR05DRAFT_963069 [Suillus weaverae]|nr:hypothetical protein BDR05DRAFT_963069 [Suillus weaverae]
MRHIHVRISGYLQSLDIRLTRCYEGGSSGSTVDRSLPTNPSNLFDPISHPHTQCVSPLQLSSLSLLLWHHQTLLLTVEPINVPSCRLFVPSESDVVHGTDARVTSSRLLSLSCSIKYYCFPAKKEVLSSVKFP